MVEDIEKFYTRLNNEYINAWVLPDAIFRDRVIRDVSLDLNKILDTKFSVKCDDENNPPDITYIGCTVATVKIENTYNPNTHSLFNLIFGSPDNIIIAQQIFN